MPRRCVVGGCNNTNREGFKLHHWPKDAKVARNWTKFVQNTRVWGKPTKWSVVCSAHFTDESYATTEMARMFGYPPTLKADAFPTIKSKKSAARPPLNVPKCVSYSGTKDLDSTASNGGSLFPQMSELNPLDVLAHTASTEDDHVKNMGPSFPGLLTSTPKLDRSAFRKRERMRVLQDMFSNSYRHSTEEDDYQTFSRADIGVQIYPDVKSKDVQQPPHIIEVEEEVWMSQEGECPVGQEEADVSKFPLTVVSVKTEEHEDKPPESSQLHHSPSSQCCGERASLAEGTSTSRAGVLGVQTTRSRAQGLLHDGGGAGNAGCRAASTRPRSRRDVLRPGKSTRGYISGDGGLGL
ncbi:uncharacterized protein LOC133546947 isoform X6 [Nerophis ophidion]|uniref:uncharacterized protein LOC133546947 isoform X6 n=1 Tax=Nerophis ophidion TaxID=159077 RepID=UPI002ADFF6E8|nr:uncharacterized protein LOC133546947 isoform X6 [Nerophis ophidion]